MGKTIIISSHILSELAEMCTTIGIIEKGSMVTKGTVDEIMSRLVVSNPIKIQIIENKEEAVKIFKEEPLVKNISIDGDYISLGFTGEQEDEAELLAKLIRNNIKVVSFVRESGNLEEVFMMVTGNKEVLN